MKRLQRPAAGTESRKSSDNAEAGENLFRNWIIGAVVVIAPFLLLGLYYKAMFAGLVNPDALDYAQIGRNLSDGHGFVTYILRPLALTHGDNPRFQPDVTHGFLYPFALALAFGALKASDTVVAMVSAGFYLLTIPVIYFLGARMFSRAVGVLAALVFTANSLMLEYAFSGLPITLEILLMTLLLAEVYNLASYKRDQGEQAGMPRWSLVRAGLLAALLYLTNPDFICVLPIVGGIVIWLFPERRWQSLGIYCLAFSPGLVWMGRNAMLTGNPIFGLRGMDVWTYIANYYPGDKVYRMAPTDVVPGTEMFLGLVSKIFSNLGMMIEQAPEVVASWVLAFFLPSLFFRFADKAANTVRAATLICIAGIVALLLVFGVEMPLLTCVGPVLLIFSVAYLLYLGQQARLSRRGAALAGFLFGMSVIYPLLSAVLFPVAKPAGLQEEAAARELAKITQPDDVTFSDQPWIVAWYADRPAMWVPAKDESVGDYRSRFNVRWMFLTDQTRGLQSNSWSWIYTRFEEWDLLSQQRQAQQMPALTVDGPNPYDLKADAPLFVALKGFTELPQLPDAPVSVVVATLPQSKQDASLPGLPGQTKQAENSAALPARSPTQ